MDGFIFRKQREIEIELLPEEMGRAFANGDSEQQAAFLNEAFKTMAKWDDARGVFQISYITPLLSPISKSLLLDMVAHIDAEGQP